VATSRGNTTKNAKTAKAAKDQIQRRFFAAFAFFAFIVCGASLIRATFGTPSDAAFTNIAASSGVTFRHDGSKTSLEFQPETMGGGVALVDYDGDGRLDLFFTERSAGGRAHGRDTAARQTRSALLESAVPQRGRRSIRGHDGTRRTGWQQV
jgi:hypothetical protein